MTDIPQNDLAHIRHENPGYEARETVLLASTPRSGSTMLCTSIDPVAGCPMAEYFQPYEIIPYLKAVRRKQVCWGLLGRYRFSPRKYARYLATHRSGPSGVLAVNFHASHLPIFDQVQPHLPRTRSMGVLVRRNVIAQAVSYYIAGKTRKWSSNYAAQAADPDYNRAELGACLKTLIDGAQTNLDRFVPMGAEILYYEDCVKAGTSYAEHIGVAGVQKADAVQTKRQSNALNAALADRFRDEIADHKDGCADLIRAYEDRINAA